VDVVFGILGRSPKTKKRRNSFFQRGRSGERQARGGTKTGRERGYASIYVWNDIADNPDT